MFRLIMLIAIMLIVLPVSALSGINCAAPGECNVVVAPARICGLPVVPCRLPQIVVAPERICLMPVGPDRACTRWVRQPCTRPENRVVGQFEF
jgi:hypothetical protein